MKWKIIWLIVLVVITVWIWVIIPWSILQVDNIRNVEASTIKMSLSLSGSPTLLSTSTPNPASTTESSIDSPTLAAWIGFAGVILAALIAAGVAVYQTKRNARLEREKIELQAKANTDNAEHERQRQHQEMDDAAVQAAMKRARTINERVQAYRDALHSDPRIARLQILDMSRPLEVANVYVRVRVHQETRLSYAIDASLLAAETRHDPNALLRASQLRLESRVSSALDPNEAIHLYGRCVIVGDPGAGKTTLLKYLTLKSAEKQLAELPDVPIYIELNAFAGSGKHDLLAFASSSWEEKYGFPTEEARAYMEDRLKNGNALLLLDALDETVIGENEETAEASYQRVANAIMQAATRYRSPIVVTARKAGYQQRTPLMGFTELEVLDFRQEDIRQFVNNWFDCYHDPQKRANATDLNARLERNPRIQALAANPLLLSLITIVYEAQLDLPDRRAELYKRCVDTLLTEWDAKRNIRRRREFKPEHKRQLLEEIAWHFHAQGLRYFPEDELLGVIASFLPSIHLLPEDNERILKEIANEQGLLKEQARCWHGFLHLTLQEYFVAQYVSDHHQLDMLLTHVGEPWWEEVLLLYAGYTADASPLLSRLVGLGGQDPLQEDLFKTNLVLAGRCLAARPTIRQASLWQEVIARLFQTLTTTKYSLIRENIANALAAIGGREVNAHLLLLLSDEHLAQDVRLSIAQALGMSGECNITSDLLRLLSDQHVDTFVRQSIVQALGALGERSVIPDLLRLLSDRNVTENVRLSIAETLGELNERRLIPDLLGLLSNNPGDVSVRRNVAQVLGKLGERTIVPSLQALLSDKQIDMPVRWSIAEALYRLGDQSVVPGLLRLLASENIEQYTRQTIVETLSSQSDQSLVPDLLRLLFESHVNVLVRWSIARVLGKLGTRSIVPDLIRLLSDNQMKSFLRQGIIEALGQLADDEITLRALIALLQTSDITDDIHKALWAVSCRAGVRLVVIDEQTDRDHQVVKVLPLQRKKLSLPEQ